MPTKLSAASIDRAINHLIKYGDTDVLPPSFECVFLSEKRAEIVSEIEKLDLDSFSPAQAVDMISPKSKLGFRIVHQFPLLESILFTACIVEIGEDIEQLKLPSSDFGPFAYRFKAGQDASLFADGHHYRDWLVQHSGIITGDNFSHVIFTDIADFYQRIYLHRIENTLDNATEKKGINRFIVKLIKQVRSKQSHGIPVGGSASRVLAEAVLTDSDSALVDEDYVFTRYVDDYRIFVRDGQRPYQILAFLAEQLATSDGLALNAQKTRVYPISEFRSYLNSQLVDVYDEAQQNAIGNLSQSLYLDEEPDETEVDKLRSMNLLKLLDEEIAKDIWDFGRIKTIFLGLRVTQNEEAIQFLCDRFRTFIPFVRELVLFFDSMNAKGKLNSVDLKTVVDQELADGASKSVPTVRVWLLELYVRRCLTIGHKQLSVLENAETLSDRQIFLIRGLNNDTNYFRRNKTRFEQKNVFERFHYLLGATCLPEDEFRTWVSAIRTNMVRPLDSLFCSWVLGKKGLIADVLLKRLELARD